MCWPFSEIDLEDAPPRRRRPRSSWFLPIDNGSRRRHSFAGMHRPIINEAPVFTYGHPVVIRDENNPPRREPPPHPMFFGPPMPMRRDFIRGPPFAYFPGQPPHLYGPHPRPRGPHGMMHPGYYPGPYYDRAINHPGDRNPIWRARTEREVMIDNYRIARMENVLAPNPMGPYNPRPDQYFMVQELDGQMAPHTYADIESSCQPGIWRRDRFIGNLYFERRRP